MKPKSESAGSHSSAAGASQAASAFDEAMIEDWNYFEMADLTREELDARLDATVSKVSASEARINASLEIFASKVDHLPSTTVLISSIIAGIVTAIGLMVAVLSFGYDRFDGGVQASSVVAVQSAETRQTSKENADQIKVLIERADKNDAKFDAILDYLKKEPQK